MLPESLGDEERRAPDELLVGEFNAPENMGTQKVEHGSRLNLDKPFLRQLHQAPHSSRIDFDAG